MAFFGCYHSCCIQGTLNNVAVVQNDSTGNIKKNTKKCKMLNISILISPSIT